MVGLIETQVQKGPMKGPTSQSQQEQNARLPFPNEVCLLPWIKLSKDLQISYMIESAFFFFTRIFMIYFYVILFILLFLVFLLSFLFFY